MTRTIQVLFVGAMCLLAAGPSRMESWGRFAALARASENIEDNRAAGAIPAAIERTAMAWDDADTDGVAAVEEALYVLSGVWPDQCADVPAGRHLEALCETEGGPVAPWQ